MRKEKKETVRQLKNNLKCSKKDKGQKWEKDDWEKARMVKEWNKKERKQ